MNTKPLIILGSARKQSDTKKLVDILFSNLDIALIDLLDQAIEPYNYEENYPAKDNFVEICDIVLQHQKIVFATPVYWCSMSGIMKVFFDRLTDLTGIHKDIGKKLKGKEIFLISVGAEEILPDGFEIPFRLTAGYFDMTFVTTYYCKATDLLAIQPTKQKIVEMIKSTGATKQQ